MSPPVSGRLSRTSTPGPSAQLQQLLERLGILSDLHDNLVQRVNALEVSTSIIYFDSCLKCDSNISF